MFSVTYEIITPESAEHGDFADAGFVSESCSLREAIDLVGNQVTEANEYPITCPRWLNNYEYGENYATGERESRSLHFPDHITAASRCRIARMLGCYGI
jgi:hypothetical protein